MSDDTVLKLSQPSTFSDPLTEVLRSGARSLLARAVEAEVAAFLDGHSEARTEEGRRRLVRHGHLPEREIMTGIGPVAVRAPRVRDRTGLGAGRIRFSSALLPPYARRSKSLEVLIPVLYLKGISTGDFAEALAALLGPDAGGLSASTVARLTEVWADQHAHWLKRDLSATRTIHSHVPITSASLGLPASGRHKYRSARRDTGTGSGITQGCGECRRWHRRNRPRPSVGIPCWPAGRPGGQVPVANLGHADQWRWSVEERRSDEGRGSGGSHSARRTPGRQEHAWNSRGRVWRGARCGGVVRRRRRAIADAAGAAEGAGECRTGPPACRCGGAAGGTTE